MARLVCISSKGSADRLIVYTQSSMSTRASWDRVIWRAGWKIISGGSGVIATSIGRFLVKQCHDYSRTLLVERVGSSLHRPRTRFSDKHHKKWKLHPTLQLHNRVNLTRCQLIAPPEIMIQMLLHLRRALVQLSLHSPCLLDTCPTPHIPFRLRY